MYGGDDVEPQRNRPVGETGSGAQSVQCGLGPSEHGPDARDVLDDLERGEQALTLRELAADPSVPHGRSGRAASVATIYR